MDVFASEETYDDDKFVSDDSPRSIASSQSPVISRPSTPPSPLSDDIADDAESYNRRIKHKKQLTTASPTSYVCDECECSTTKAIFCGACNMTYCLGCDDDYHSRTNDTDHPAVTIGDKYHIRHRLDGERHPALQSIIERIQNNTNNEDESSRR